jgi:hypothetical protein
VVEVALLLLTGTCAWNAFDIYRSNKALGTVIQVALVHTTVLAEMHKRIIKLEARDEIT